MIVKQELDVVCYSIMALLHGSAASNNMLLCLLLKVSTLPHLLLAVKRSLWARCLLINLGYKQPHIWLFSDNQAAIRLVFNPEYHKRTKHINVAYHKIRKLQQHGKMSVTQVSTHLQLANILTKALPREKFIKLRSAPNVIKHTATLKSKWKFLVFSFTCVINSSFFDSFFLQTCCTL